MFFSFSINGKNWDIFKEETYSGMCDASAIIILDENTFAVAGDEQNRIYTYEFGNKEPVDVLDVGEFFNYSGSSSEMDLEAVANIGNTFYWITSHGRSKKGNLKPNRYALFSTEFKNGKIQSPNQKKPYEFLVESIYKDENLIGKKKDDPYELYDSSRIARKKDKRLAPKDKGMNIEGLAEGPNESLFIGFRNPRPANKAIILPLLNPGDIDNRKRLRFDKPILLDLKGLGIRALEFVKDHNKLGTGYFIIAGSYDNSDEYQIYFWSWPNFPQLAKNKLIPLFKNPGDSKPEGISYKENRLILVSDDGRRIIKGKECKDIAAENPKEGLFRVYHIR
ncbi:MAG: DUF3616 domain-containing protein [Leptospira sp.]|nr:DUF3616 domain-containing protein [Leptospira sp.]